MCPLICIIFVGGHFRHAAFERGVSVHCELFFFPVKLALEAISFIKEAIFFSPQPFVSIITDQTVHQLEEIVRVER